MKTQSTIKNDFTLLFVARISELKDNTKLPKFAIDEINCLHSQKLIEQKRASYALLDFALKKYLQNDDDFSRIYKDNGKPYSKDFYFSFSHCHNLVALGISNHNIGVDIEKIKKIKNKSKFIQYLHNEGEAQSDDLIKLWTKKESAFKLQGGEKFIPSQIDTSKFTSKSYKVGFDDEFYYITICMESDFEVCFYNLI